MLFGDIVFGPIHSRRLGVSLGINLLPSDGKVCSFDCIYCECGLNIQGHGTARLPLPQEVKQALEAKLKAMAADNKLPDVITFAGNGEPTLHPLFSDIIHDTISLRNQYAPKCRVAVLSNASRLSQQEIVQALKLVDDNILKLDAGSDAMAKLIDVPNTPDYSLSKVAQQMQQFDGRCTVQTLFLRGTVNGTVVDNTTEEELAQWFEHLKVIHPEVVMIYSFSRLPAINTLLKVEIPELEIIARRVEELLPGVKTIVA